MLREEVSQLLMFWDPIEVKESQWALETEYEDYVDEIAEAVYRGADCSQLRKILSDIEQNRMGLSSEHKRTAVVAEKLAALSNRGR